VSAGSGGPGEGSPFDRALARARSGDLDDRCDGVARLAALHDAGVTPALVSLLDESSWFLRDRVVEALVARPDATGPLLAMLREGAWFARASACDALGRRGDLAAVPGLVEQVEDRNVSLQKSAVEALQRLADAHGSAVVARAVAGLPPGRRRRVIARIGHQAPHWADGLERALAEVPGELFAEPSGEEVRAASSVGESAAAAALVRFRRWLGALPRPEGDR
jgi:hypothetical protein